MNGKTDLPLVSICCTCYNHEAYIRQTLDGFLLQKTNFTLEIIIFDDASTDNTQAIIIEYADKYPSLFRLFLQKDNLWQNKGISGTYTITYPNARGKYIAVCEGDDYWTDPYKLQKQVDFLESNDDYGMVHTKNCIYIQEQDRFELQDQIKHVGAIFENLLFENEIVTLTVLVRTDLVHKAIADNFYNNSMVALDYPLWLHIARYSKIYFLDDITGVYRKLSESASNYKDELKSYKFIIGIVDIKILIAEKFQCLDLILDYVSDYKKRNLKYGYLNDNKEISKQAYLFLSKHNKLSIRDRLFYLSTMIHPIRQVSKFIVNLKNNNGK